MTGDKSAGSFRVSSLTSSVYLPNLLFSIGQGAVIPMIALVALEKGASEALAGLVVGLRGVGMMVFDVPAGALVARIGERRAMIVSGVVLSGVAAAMLASPPLWLFALLVTVMGCTWSLWLLARVAFATGASTLVHRGRVMSTIGGVSRIGLFVGPLLGSLLVAVLGVTGPFLVLAVLTALAAITMTLSSPPPFSPEPASNEHRSGVLSVLRDHRRTLATAGSVAVAAQILRSSREALIPLWGERLGITAETIPLLFAAGAAIESSMFYPVGMLMDRRGRKWTMVPFLALLTTGIVAIPLTDGVVSLAAVAILIGAANGLGSGMNMTLGSDLSPQAGRSRFLGVWRLVTDAGNVSGPLLVAAVTSAVTLGAAAFAVGAVGLTGLLVLWRLVPETLVTDGGDG